MNERATGLVLRTRRLTETSLIVHWITPEFGRIATVARGALRPKSPFRGKLDLFYRASLSFARSRRSDLHTLREVSLAETHAALRRELGWLRQAAYAARLIEQTTETETPLPAVFQLLEGLLDHLPKHPPQPHTVFAFELKLLAELGQTPDLAQVALSPGSRQILDRLQAGDWPAVGPLRPSPAQIREIGAFLHGFLVYHLDRIPPERGRAVSGD
jgi:DNA repair protein RecO